MLGWRTTFLGMSGLTLVLIGWVLWQVPDFAGQPAGRRAGLRQVLRLPGVRPILLVTLLFVLAHNILYTYIAPFLEAAGLGKRVELALFVFGAAALASIALMGVMIDRHLRSLVLASTALFAGTSLALGLWSDEPALVLIAIAVWGVTTLFQTALAQAAGGAADLAQSMLVTVWNTAIAGGGLIGGLLLDRLGVAAFLWALIIATAARRHGFPPA